MPNRHPNLEAVCRHFALPGKLTLAEAFGSGHINTTYRIVTAGPNREHRYILQRINSEIFTDVPALMENIARVCSHVARSKSNPEEDRQLRLVETREAKAYHEHEDGTFWRVYAFIEGAETHDLIRDPAQAYEAALAFGRFQALLTDLPPPRLHDTIPNFHNTRRRYDAFAEAVEIDACNRAIHAREEIEFARAREPLVDVLVGLQSQGSLPERITHNDTKINNVMLDSETGKAVCVIDFDTIMPGLSLYDFGDMARSATNSAPEDEPDASKVHVQLPVFEALVKGYLEYAHRFLNEVEIAHLVASARLITFEIGLRFLADYLQGDTYFKTERPAHNLDRCRSQFALVRSMEKHESDMCDIVDRVARHA